jgi:adenylate cyclase
MGMALSVLGAAQFASRRFDEAIPNLLLGIQEDPTFPEPYRYLAACYAHIGRLDEAQNVVRRLRAITPSTLFRADYLRNLEHRELLLAGLRLAAGETSQTCPAASNW